MRRRNKLTALLTVFVLLAPFGGFAQDDLLQMLEEFGLGGGVGGVLGEVGELFRIFLHVVEHEALRLGALGGGVPHEGPFV